MSFAPHVINAMPERRRTWRAGGTWLVTGNGLQRHGNYLLVRHINSLGDVLRAVRSRHPFAVHGWMVLPEHMHCVIEVPPGDSDFSDFAVRWRVIKARFSS